MNKNYIRLIKFRVDPTIPNFIENRLVVLERKHAHTVTHYSLHDTPLWLLRASIVTRF